MAFFLTAWAGTAEARRVALLVGNDAYDVGRLSYPAQDIEVMRKALIAAGFAAGDIVAERNADQRRLRRAIQDFGRRAHGADVALFYFSGHGAQVLGQNWLVPVGAEIHTEGGYELDAVPAQAVLTQLASARPRVGIVVLDACRDNPQAVSRAGTKGLARMEAGDRTLIAFSTAPNDTAADTGLYARVLASQLQTPGLELLDAFRKTTAEVRRQTGGRQVPRVSEVTLDERVVLLPTPTSAPRAAEGPTSRPETAALRLDDIEAEQRQRQASRAQVAQMQRDFDRVAALNAATDLQVRAWVRFLEAWSANMPDTNEDDVLRQAARERLATLQAAPTPGKPIESTALATGSPSRAPAGRAAEVAPATVAAAGTAWRVGQVLAYVTTDLYTRARREVRLQVTDAKLDRTEFDDGARVELSQGQLAGPINPLLGPLDTYQPPGGWWAAEVRQASLSPLRYQAADGAQVLITAASAPKAGTHMVGARPWATEVMTLRGEIDIRGLQSQPHVLEVTVHYAPGMRRVVRLDFKAQGPSWASSFNRDARERIELVAVD